ncbi:MAG: hypothetical protein JSU68_10150 [Phycisphaerales bacterium]|nr:MAG: hypothetical protein JSU68_10150 [Phycisphaerales bacterium]
MKMKKATSGVLWKEEAAIEDRPRRGSGESGEAAKAQTNAEPWGPACPARFPTLAVVQSLPRERRKRRWALLLVPLAALCAITILSVGWDLLSHTIFPNMPMGLRHGLLTTWACMVTSVASVGVYLLMIRPQRRLSATAEQLTQLLESYQRNPASTGRFENPHLKHCRDVLKCDQPECRMYNARGERCWQILALSRADEDHLTPRIEILQCLACEVYRQSCPDKLTELGESFNNLMFLLETKARQVGRMQNEMLEKEKMVAIGQIAAGIAHEVGNPLSSISSIVQMLKRKGSNGPMREQLNLIETHIQRISGTVRQLVHLARPRPARWERLDVGKTLEEAIDLISFDRRAKNVDIDVQLPKSLPPTYGLHSELQQVFINLALNALDAMPEGGKLAVRAKRREANILVSFRDTGCGISEEVGRRMFEPFFTTKEPGQGTGLGLAVSYGIIQKHGGTIDYNSAPEAGTTFTIRLPVRDSPPDIWHATGNNSTSRR